MVAPRCAKECCLLLAKAANDDQAKSIGNQAGGKVFLFLFTDDFERNNTKLFDRNVSFIRPPQDFGYGRVAVFEHLNENMCDLIQPNENNMGLYAELKYVKSRFY